MRLLPLLAVTLSASASAFCGFYVSGADQSLFNNATQVVLMREATRTVLSMQNNYQGPAKDFAMVVPVPVVLQQENVKTLSKDIFMKVDRLAAPRLVEYWERDPCYVPPTRHSGGGGGRMKAKAAPRVDFDDRLVEPDYGVKIEAKFTVGEYDIVILAARDALGLDRWLRDNRYKIPAGAEPLFKPYIEQGWKFFVAKVAVAKVVLKDGQAQLSPLRFHYDSEAFTLPIRLGLINANQKQDLIVHILARGTRYEVANYPNVTIPTNIDLHESAKVEFAPFYASLFDRTLQKTPKAVVTEYAWSSASCDPCPLPPLTEAELDVLGRDVLVADGELPEVELKNADKLKPDDRQFVEQYLANLKSQVMARRGLYPNQFVLTRLHARYDKASLGEDLVFKTAPVIAGGREHLGEGGRLEQGAVPQPYGNNNFQGRYAIRHAWREPITCANPIRGRWGPPWPGLARELPLAATDTAFVPRKLELVEKLAESPVAELGIKGKKDYAGVAPR